MTVNGLDVPPFDLRAQMPKHLNVQPAALRKRDNITIRQVLFKSECVRACISHVPDAGVDSVSGQTSGQRSYNCFRSIKPGTSDKLQNPHDRYTLGNSNHCWAI